MNAKVLSVIVGAVLAGAPGCRGLSAWGNSTMVDVVWKKDGFTVSDIRREFSYDADGPTEVAELDGRLTLTDTNADGTVDVVQSDGGRWARGEPGTDEVFADADRRFGETRDYLYIDDYRAEWEQMTPIERAHAGGLDRRP